MNRKLIYSLKTLFLTLAKILFNGVGLDNVSQNYLPCQRFGRLTYTEVGAIVCLLLIILFRLFHGENCEYWIPENMYLSTSLFYCLNLTNSQEFVFT